jgi:hypothetical protein
MNFSLLLSSSLWKVCVIDATCVQNSRDVTLFIFFDSEY